MSGAGTGAWQTPGPGAPDRRVPGTGRTGAGKGTTPVVEPPATPAERHLGDRLAALVDGELGHDSRERVLAHLATCDQCRAEADEQRRLKNVFAVAASVAPGPSAGLLARLQGLPGGADGRGGGGDGKGPFGGMPDLGLLAERDRVGPGRQRGPIDAEALATAEREERERATAAVGGPTGSTGFRIHDFSKAARPAPPRGRRFAFAAAGAFSLAAVALGALPVDDASQVGRSEEPGSTVTPSVARPGGGLLSSTGQDEPFFVNGPVTLVSVHQPMRLSPSSSPSAPGASPSLLGGPGMGTLNR